MPASAKLRSISREEELIECFDDAEARSLKAELERVAGEGRLHRDRNRCRRGPPRQINPDDDRGI
jgi:hypothetical protein